MIENPNSNTGNWTINAVNAISWHSADCPSSGPACWQLCGQNPNVEGAYIYRIASTEGYQKIELTYSMTGEFLWDGYDYCEIFYTLNNQTNNWNQIASVGKWDSPHQDVTYSFDDNGVNADNNAGLGIFIYANTGWDTACCRMGGFELTGIPIPTTANPTIGPTENSDSPSNVPSPSPTIAEPTS